ncbi:hypothetical protein OHB26_16495 [Nocardia sp. NBC_01503]|uniref:hypothetical protein n=1 Tax=Nocardia sp. NBC_01503 TaxID=2975997 RepID=UPI002E7BA56B|nr:hypothetical protein [Nocardia sp. NBC_01503]WTL35651.1 hypothetical protein OHB26_16495 [Nocardia sp. NBC_01503]
MRFEMFAPAVVLTAGILTAQPVAAADPVETGVTATQIGDTAVLTIENGTIALRDGVLTFEAPDHTVLAGAEMSFRVDDFTFPIDADITAGAATLTPRLDLDHAVYTPVALPFEDSAGFQTPYQREQAAWNRLSSTIAMGAILGTLIGGLGGAAVGCVLGGAAAATVAAATIVGLFGSFLPAAAIGCLSGVAAIGTLGTIAGQLFVTAPIAVLAAAQYFTTITAPMP